MSYHWRFSKKAQKQLKNLDHVVQVRIVRWLDEYIEGTANPRMFGKALEGNLHTLWRYRVGKYRIIADIVDDEFVVEVLKTGKREDVYK